MAASPLLLGLVVLLSSSAASSRTAPSTDAAASLLLRSNHNGDHPPSSSHPRRHLQANFLTGILSSIIPFYAPNQYTLQPVEAFEVTALCTGFVLNECNAGNVIQYTTLENPGRNQFRYHNTGPVQLQGVFWTIQEQLETLFAFTDEVTFASSDLVSFARTRHGGGVQSGVLQTDANGYEYVLRPLGDHSWSASSNSPDTFLSGLDVLYLYDLVEGTLEDPRAFEITPSFKFLAPCLRFNFGTLTRALARFDLTLVTDPTDPALLDFPGSVVWKRRTTFLGGLFQITYLTVQIVDGSGAKIPAAYAKLENDVPVTLVTALQDDRVNEVQEC